MQAIPPLLDLNSDNIYEEHCGLEEEAPAYTGEDSEEEAAIYSTMDEITNSDSVSNLTAMSDTSSIYECDFRSRVIHSQTLSSSYLIPITTFEEGGEEEVRSEEQRQYDNVNKSVVQEADLINF